ncbi:hypothetical protein ES703_16346 [subsurface metagenome]
MTEGKEVSVPNCIMGFKACYPSFQCKDCSFWRNDRCDYEAIVAVEESIGQLGTVYPELSKPQLRVLARFAEFLKSNKG